jgi:hypothetical protein
LNGLQSLQAETASKGVPDQGDTASWHGAARGFDALHFSASPAEVDPYSSRYRPLDYGERTKVNATLRYASKASGMFRDLGREFQRQGGQFLLDPDRDARYMAAAAVDGRHRPVIVLTWDLLNRYNGRAGEMARGAPWEFIASMLAREMSFHWYAAIPSSAEKVALSFIGMVRVFVDLTNGTSKSWATDKDFQAMPGDQASFIGWNWFEKLTAAARDAAAGAQHLLDSEFLSWARSWAATPVKSEDRNLEYNLWEQYNPERRYYRPGESAHGQPLPPGAPVIDKQTFDDASYSVYGADGKGNDQQGNPDPANTALGSIIRWLQDRLEI